MKKLWNVLRFGSDVQNGQSLVELLIVIGLFGIFLPTLLTGLLSSREGKAAQDQQLAAIALLKESQEAIRVIRDTDWNALTVNGSYHPIASSSAWELASGPQTINGFTRQIDIADVYRDSSASGTIVPSGGYFDPTTRKITITVSWTQPTVRSIQAVSYLGRYQNNITFVQTTQADFNAGTKTSVDVVNNAGGEIVLGAGGVGNWCMPQNSLINTLTLPKQGNTIRAIQGSAFIGTGDGTSGVTFAKVNITNPPWPATPSASIAGTYASSYKTNDVFSDGNYAYLATDGSSSQVNILDLTQPPPYPRIGWIDVPSGLPANGVYVSNNIAYVTSGNRLYTFNVATKTGAHTVVISQANMWIGLGSNPLAKQVVVVGNYAFVGTANTLFGLQKFRYNATGVLQRSTPVGVSNLTWQQAAQGVSVNPTGQRAYVAFNNGAGFFSKGFFIVDTSDADPPSWWPFPNFYDVVGSYNAGNTDPVGMSVVTGNKALIVGTGGTQQYQVVDITDETNPTLCGGLAISQGVSGVASVLESDGDAFSYIISGEANNQFKIIQGGLGGGQYLGSGVFESSTIDATNSALFNRFFVNAARPPQTTLTFQVAVADANPITSNCTGVTFSFVGPDGTSSTTFATNSAIPISTAGVYRNPGRCFRYKAFLSTTDQTQTPMIYDMTVNVSP